MRLFNVEKDANLTRLGSAQDVELHIVGVQFLHHQLRDLVDSFEIQPFAD